MSLGAAKLFVRIIMTTVADRFVGPQAAAGVKGLKVALAYSTPKGTLITPTWAMND
jgi:hypothetical protein